MKLQAGQIQVNYENGFLRYFCVNGKEILRMIYFAVRDQDWNTIPLTLSNEIINQTEEKFSISYEAEVHQGPIQMQWKVWIEGTSDSTITFDIQGFVQHTFLKNRLGFCVLHPIERTTGKPCLVEHPDGTTTQSFFPTYISPYQPFKNISAMQWQTGKKSTFHLDFEGDLFETEDHRNWTDTSFKTYCTPLELPFPVEVKAGDTIQQKCIFRIVDYENEGTRINNKEESVLIRLTGQTSSFPQVGVGSNPEQYLLEENEIQFLKTAGFSHLRADVDLTHIHWQGSLRKALEQSAVLQIPLELALFFGDNPENEVLQLLSHIHTSPIVIKTILVFDAKTKLSTTSLLRKVVPAIRLGLPTCKVGGGTDANFAEVNRNVFDYNFVDFISYSVNPQVHASDNLTIIENMSAQADTVHSAKRLTAGKSVHISPVTLKPRFNAVATSGSVQAIPPSDERQSSDFIAGWTVGSLKYLSEAGAASITYFETAGKRGIYSGNSIYPVGEVLVFILKIKPHQIYISSSSQPLEVTSLIIKSAQKTYLLLANHTTLTKHVQVDERIQMQQFFVLSGKQKSEDMQSLEAISQLVLLSHSIMAIEVSIKLKPIQ